MNIDPWNKGFNTRVSEALESLKSDDPDKRIKALVALVDLVTPWELLDGEGDYRDLMALMQRPEVEETIPHLIDLLSSGQNEEKGVLLEMLYDLARYKFVDPAFIAKELHDRYLAWTDRLREAVRKGTHLYVDLTDDPSEDIRELAWALLKMLEEER